jgi:hypothetical protein
VRANTASYVKVVVLQRDHDRNRRPHRHGLLVYGIWQTVGKSAPDQERKYSVCGTTKRTLQWMRSWEDCIHVILNTLIGERP